MINIEKEACLFRGMPLFGLFVKREQSRNTALFGKEDI